MSINKNYAVFGLGRYGRAVAKELVDNGAEVIVVDSDSKTVEEFSGDFPICKCADVTEQEAIKRLGISIIDVVVIAITDSFETSVMATMLCKEAGVKQVIVKCSDELHRTILEKVGADMVVLPEKESGTRLAKNILSSGFIDIADISENISILELDVRKDWIGKSLRELEIRKMHEINVIALTDRNGVSTTAQPDDIISEGMKVIVVADKNKISKIK